MPVLRDQRYASDPLALSLWPTTRRPLSETAFATVNDPPPGRSPRAMKTPVGIQRPASKPTPLLRVPTITAPLPETSLALLRVPPKLTPPRPWKLSPAHAAVENSSAPVITDF